MLHAALRSSSSEANAISANWSQRRMVSERFLFTYAGLNSAYLHPPPFCFRECAFIVRTSEDCRR